MFIYYGKTDLKFSSPEKVFADTSSLINTNNAFFTSVTGDFNGDDTLDVAVCMESSYDMQTGEYLPNIKIYLGGKNCSSIPNKRLFFKSYNYNTGKIDSLNGVSLNKIVSINDLNGDNCDELLMLGNGGYNIGSLYLGDKEKIIQDEMALSLEGDNAGQSSYLSNAYYDPYVQPIINFSGKGMLEFIGKFYDREAPGNTFMKFTLVNPLNEAPSDVELDNTSITENMEPMTAVGNLSAVDGPGVDYHRFFLDVDDNDKNYDNDLFKIEDNKLLALDPFNFEDKNTYKVYVIARDASSEIFGKLIDINITDANDVPTKLELADNVIDENAAVGTLVGQFETIDEDKDDMFTYALVAGDGTNDADNAKFEIFEGHLKAKESFDYETQATMKVNVKVTDSGDASIEKAFEVKVNDLTETSTGELQLTDLKLYPNPVKDQLNIEFVSEEYTISIFAVDGRLLHKEDVKFGASKTLNLDFNYRGLMIVRLQSEKGMVQKRLIRE